MGAMKRTGRAIERRARELGDLARRRQTETPREVGYRKKSHVVIGQVRQAGEKFEAEFVPPRLGSQLAPYHDHNTVLAYEAGAHQVAVWAMKNTMGFKGVEMLVTQNSFKWRKKASPNEKITIEVRKTGEDQTQNTRLVTFFCRFLRQDGSVAHGSFTVGIIKKKT
ncbi:MAG: hypothetical protein HY392_00340 [Candidatus Diapherotrites archaeon]|nr:hypothetical protein [Candidatus Diapherotrites archaeon]